jgi:hypothetical protein
MIMISARFAWRLASLALAVGVVACDNDRLPTMNSDPNNPTSAPAGPVFTRAVAAAVGRWFGAGYDMRSTELVAQHMAEVQYPNEDQYNRLQGGDTQGHFNNAYVTELQDLSKVIAAGKAANDAGVWGPATIMQVWVFSYLTDTWGDIPYSEALQGDSTGGTLTPKYDKQEDIYTSLFQRLTDAVAAMRGVSGTSSLGSYDILYGGDLSKWAEFANSLRARLALRVVNVAPSVTNAQLAAALSDPAGVIIRNADNAELVWPGDGTYDNPWADVLKTRDDLRMSQTLMTIMAQANDPRIPIYAQPVLDSTRYPGGYGGMPNGLTQDSAQAWFNISSRPGVIFFPGRTLYGTFGDGSGLAMPSYLFTAAEMNFILAEAAERGLGGVSGSAASYYEAAIRASMEQWGVTDQAAINAFLNDPGIAYQGGQAGLVQIAVQKWVALFGDGGQAWAEWRRTCQPVTVHAGWAALVPYVPRRFEYSRTEYSVNGDNVAAAASQMGGADDFKTRMWWDSQPAAAPTYDAGQCNDP